MYINNNILICPPIWPQPEAIHVNKILICPPIWPQSSRIEGWSPCVCPIPVVIKGTQKIDPAMIEGLKKIGGKR